VTSALSVSLDVSATPARPAGAGRYIVELARALAERDDLSLTLVTRGHDTARWRQLAPSARLLPLVPSARPMRLAYERLVLAGRLRAAAQPPLEVHHGPHYTLPGGSLRGLGKVVTIHDMTFFDHPEWHEKAKVPFFRKAIKQAAKRANVLICVSELTAERLRSILAPSVEVTVVPHGADLAKFRPPTGGADDEADGNALRTLGLDPRGRFIFQLGTAEPRKGLAHLVRAFDEVAASDPEVRLVLAGLAGWGGGELQAALDASTYPDRIHRLGWVDEDQLPALLRRAAVVAYPSVEEGFGMPVLEAMACGAPIVTSAGTSMAELAGETAWTCPPAQPERLAATLLAVLRSSPAEKAARARAGIARAGTYTWARSAQSHAAAYRRAAELAAKTR
jgi:glycosyltransferase involved in cell wall biosynthesis